ncbi:MAG: succinate dehydrogenase/fumarate reductase iron-sulfur subunit [Syntrophothermus sp.]
MNKHLNLTLKIWRQANRNTVGGFVTYPINNISTDASFLEMLDILNEELQKKNEDPVAFDHDCREGICGACGLVINGRPHGPLKGTTTCQLHMRHFKDGDTIVIEPWRAKAFPVIKDLMVDRSAFEKIQQAGGFVSINTGGVPDANAIPVSKEIANIAMDAAACIGCGACVAACKNASAMLFTAAKVSHLSHLPQGQVEKFERVEAMVKVMDEMGFGSCTNTYACEAECPKEISVSHIAKMNRDYLAAKLKSKNK